MKRVIASIEMLLAGLLPIGSLVLLLLPRSAG